MKCMYEYSHHKMYAWMHDAIQKDEISIRNKENMNLLVYGALLGMNMIL